MFETILIRRFTNSGIFEILLKDEKKKHVFLELMPVKALLLK